MHGKVSSLIYARNVEQNFPLLKLRQIKYINVVFYDQIITLQHKIGRVVGAIFDKDNLYFNIKTSLES